MSPFTGRVHAGVLSAICACAVGMGGCSSSPAPAKPRAPKLVSSVWSPETVGLCAQLDLGVSAARGDGLIGDAQYRLSGPTLPRPVYASPSERGAICFTLAETPSELRRVRPGPLTVEALIGGNLTTLGTVMLDEASLDELFEASLEISRSEVGAPGTGGEVEIEYRVEPLPVDAGGFVSLFAEARSTGTRPVYQLKVLLQPMEGSDLDATAFDFGKLSPGESLSLEKRISVPRWTRDESAEFGVMATEKHGATIESIDSVSLEIDPLPTPALDTALRVALDEANAGTETHALRPGDDVHLVCTLHNFGQTPLKGVVARLESPRPDLISVRTGRAFVGDLPPSATGRAHFWLVVTAPLGSGPIPVVAQIEDADLGIVSESATLLVIQPGDGAGANASR